MISIVTFLWRDPNYRWNSQFIYGPEHVERLARSVRRNLDMPHRFICVSDYDRECFKEPDLVLPLWADYRYLGGCYVRLKAFSPEIRKSLGERFAWLDVDIVVVGELDSLFNRTEEFIAWKDVNPPTPYCGSMMMMTAGARKEVWEDFDPETSPQLAKRYIGTDQAWIGYRLGPNEATWTEADGVYSYANHIVGSRNHYCEKWQLPANAKIVVFHGSHDPSQAEVQRRCPWVKEYWV